MKRMGNAQVFLGAIVCIGLCGMLIATHWVIKTGALLVILLGGFALLKLQASRLEEMWRSRMRTQEQESQVKLIQVMNRLRHDWMNDTQILFGYIQLKKFDNLKPHMEKIKTTMVQESNLSKLGIPSLIAYFLELRVTSKRIEVHVDLEQEVLLGQLPIAGGLIENVIREVFGCFEAHAKAEEGDAGELSLEFDQEEDGLLLDFVYQGAIDPEGLERALRQRFGAGTSLVRLERFDGHEEEAELELRLPFRT